MIVGSLFCNAATIVVYSTTYLQGLSQKEWPKTPYLSPTKLQICTKNWEVEISTDIHNFWKSCKITHNTV